jgi:hypothetical protein
LKAAAEKPASRGTVRVGTVTGHASLVLSAETASEPLALADSATSTAIVATRARTTGINLLYTWCV